MARKMWAHQRFAFDKYKDRESFGLLFPTGTGKTLTASRIAEAKDLIAVSLARLLSHSHTAEGVDASLEGL